MRSIFLEAADINSTLLRLPSELNKNFEELELIYNLIVFKPEQKIDQKIIENTTIEELWSKFPSDLRFLNFLYEVSKNYENFKNHAGFFNYIFKKTSAPIFSLCSELVFRVAFFLEK